MKADKNSPSGLSKNELASSPIVEQALASAKSTQKILPTRCGGTWSDAKYNSFIKSALRTASVRWPPRYQCLHDAFVERGINPSTGRLAKLYKCCKCKGIFTQANIEINHITPVVPLEGFSSWDALIERLFCEKDGLEAVCKPCHKLITAGENKQRKENKKNDN